MKKSMKIILIFFYILLLIIIARVKISDFKLQKINNEITRASKEVKVKYLTNNSDLIKYPNKKDKIGTSISEIISLGLDPYYYMSKARLIDVDIKQLQKENQKLKKYTLNIFSSVI